MLLPYMNQEEQKSRQQVIRFLGLNLGDDFRAGELSDCENLSSRQYPYLSQRRKRKLVRKLVSPTSLHAKGKLCIVDGLSFYYDGEAVGIVTEGPKQMATVGNIVVIFPDKKYYDTDKKVFGSMEETYTSGEGQITFTKDGITSTGEDFPFRMGDGVKISGCTSITGNNKTAVVKSVAGKVMLFADNTFTEGAETAAVTIKREVPDLDFVCESNYRLWGCHGKTIYASKYGDPFNFSVFEGLSGDSYYIDVGSDGEWTGCIQYSTQVLFFKEDVLHKVFGTKPANFQVNTANIYGVQAGCAGSLRIVNETLYYKGRNGIYAYTGGIPDLISPSFGQKHFYDATAESDGERYWISMKDEKGYGVYVYDISHGIWLKEDTIHVKDFAFLDGKIYFLEGKGLYAMDDETSDERVAWSATFCPFNEMIQERKGYSKLYFRVDLDEGAWLSVDVNEDEAGWHRVYTTHSERIKTMSIPILPGRCDSFQVRLCGEGYCTIKSFVREFLVGSEV